MSRLPEELVQKLRAPFDPEDISWKPQTVNYSSKTALAVAYADPRAYADRLNEVFGVGGWSDEYRFVPTPFTKFIKGKKPWGAPKEAPIPEDKLIPGNKALCVATVSIPEFDISISSTGDSDASDENAATSAEAQAFKRAVMKLGLGRYLYKLPKVTAAYDNGWIHGEPTLPDWALPTIDCEDCSKVIESVIHNDKTYDVASLTKNSQAKYHKNLCAACQKERASVVKEKLDRDI